MARTAPAPESGAPPSPLMVSADDGARLLGISRAQWWKLHSAGRLPLPLRFGSRAPRWRVDELRAWLEAGAPDRDSWQRFQRGGRA